MVKYFIAILFTTSVWCNSSAQDQKYSDDYKSGYRGGYIKNIERLENSLNFLVIGGWGRNGEYLQKKVADQMANASYSLEADFFISTGDNFYPNGIASVNDPLWRYSFEEVYKHFALQNRWYIVLGNHDYRGNVEAEIEYSKISQRWNLPARYYSKKFLINEDSNQQILVAFIDTDPFIKSYYVDPNYQEAVKLQDTTAQKKWLEGVLSDNSPAIKWKIVVGHHPSYTSGKRRENDDIKDIRYSFTPLFEKYKVDVYIAGHERHLEHDKPAGFTNYFISGAGAETRPVNAKLENITKFLASDHGFIAFSVLADKMLVQVINHEGKILYTTTIKK